MAGLERKPLSLSGEACRGVGLDGLASPPTMLPATTALTRQESAEAVLATGMEVVVKGQTSGEGDDGKLVIEGTDRSQPTLWALDDAEQVQPAERVQERDPSSVHTETNLHPPKAEGLWKQAFSLPNLHRAMQRVVSNRGATGIDGVEVQQLRSHFDQSVAKRPVSDSIKAPTDRSPCAGSPSPSPTAPSGSWGCRPCWTALSSRRCYRCSPLSSTRTSAR